MKYKTYKLLISTTTIIAISMILWGSLSEYQKSRYNPGITKDDIYNINRNNCVDMTNELRYILSLIHIPTVTLTGNNKNKNSEHQWIGIPIFDLYINVDATTLTIFNPLDDYQNIRKESD